MMVNSGEGKMQDILYIAPDCNGVLECEKNSRKKSNSASGKRWW
jgi:hypothetical protein